ncbi:unnamed protein product [Parascedosporium putredinis]|uniref:Uncharacterized protein n=1 Tax=Parascedosporium putredinis TaxID=1442378 RepID=A0A9P1H8C8_9PEZI|nr:unnamed protein product [Parascedosporium putredinis]CAI8000675.1 unnamed protein product [Parascedosporium putredinis]
MLRNPLANTLRASPSRRIIQNGTATGLESWMQHRTLTTTTPLASKVIFDKTSNPELDAVFTEMLHKIILPARLPKKKRKIVSNAKFNQMLRVDPIVVEAVRLMATRDDWNNLPRMLAGYRNAERRILAKDVSDIVKNAGRSGNIYAIIDALRNVKESGLRIRTLAFADEVLYWVQMRAVESGFAEDPTAKTKTWAVMLRELMEDPDHSKHPTGEDADGKVAELAETLSYVWPAGKAIQDIHQSNLAPDAKVAERVRFQAEDDAYLTLSTTNRISVSSFILHGIELAKQVVAPELAAKLEPIAQVLKSGLEADKAANVKADRGWAVYDKLIAKKA